jgi:glycosyltransferase involved in cell wall biosynthesis
VTERAPTASVGLAVRNAVDGAKRCIESVLCQDFPDLELVISDNASDDGTRGVLEEYARADHRIRLSMNAINVGLHENVNRVFELSRGTYFRWISADDWLEPEYLSACVGALEARDDAIGVTTHFTIHTPDGGTRYEEYDGEFPTSADPARRFERMLWFYHAGDAKYDPTYGLYRRETLMRSGRIRASEQADWIFTAELALMGPILHVPRRLVHRTRDDSALYDPVARRRRLDPARGEELRSSSLRLYRDLLGLLSEAGLTDDQVLRCRRGLRRFWMKDLLARGRFRLSRVRRRTRQEHAARRDSSLQLG